MSGFELNKVFAALLVAGIIAMFGGFVAEVTMHPHELHEDAVAIDGAPVAAAGVTEAMPEPIMHLIAAADITTGEKLSKACAACHSFDKGGANKVGPNLWGVVGSSKGHVSSFGYSDGMLAKGGNWDYDSLNKFLWKPKKYIDGTKMNYVGIKKSEDRAAMIAWLKTLGADAYPLPTEAQIAAEAAELSPEPEESVSEEGVEAEGADDLDTASEGDVDGEAVIEPKNVDAAISEAKPTH